MIEVLKFQRGHVDLMEFRPQELAGCEPEVAQFRVVELAAQSEQCGTVVSAGRVIAVIGFMVLWKGVIQGWIVPTKYVYTAPVGFAKMIKRYIKVIARTFKCHRFETGSYDDPFHARWMRFLEFENEGVARQYTPDKKDYVKYARLF